MPGPRTDAGWRARLSVAGSPVCTPDWLALREPADAAARDTGLVEHLLRYLAATGAGPLLVRDLGCGSGSMGRWLAPQLPYEQRWILHDRDESLLARAAVSLPAGVSTGTSPGDLADLDATRLSGTTLVTCSALLDLLTADEVDRLAAACAAAGCAVLWTLSVAGEVMLRPLELLDPELAVAFDDHQRRVVHGRRMLGPDAPEVAAEALARHGYTVRSAPSPWRLGAEHRALAEEWLRGWIEAACDNRPGLAAHAEIYLRRRLRDGIDAVVGHTDLLALPPGALR